jgi:hypothetical protein
VRRRGSHTFQASGLQPGVSILSGVRENILQTPVRFEVFTAAIMKNVVFWDIKKTSSYLTGDTLLLRYRAQPVNAM